jgi:hypothetical protein
MESFRINKIIDNWGTVYAGLKRQWLTPMEVIKYCESGNIGCSKERLEELVQALKESLFVFF